MVLLPCNNCCQCFECQYTKANCLSVTFDGFSHSDESCNECNFLDDSSFVLTRTWNSTPIVSASVVAAAGTGAVISTAIQKTDAGHYEVTDIKLASGGSGYSEDAAVKFGVSYGSATCKPPKASLTIGRAAPEITASITSETGVGSKLGVTLAGPSGGSGSELWSVSAVDVLTAGSKYKDDDAVTFSVKSGTAQAPASAKITVGRSQPTLKAQMADPSLDWVALFLTTSEFEDKSGKKYWSVGSLTATLNDDNLFANEWVTIEPDGDVVTLEAADVYASVTAVVSGVSVTSKGSGYTVPPAVVFSGGGGSGAAATANLINGEVASVTIDSPGAGYTSTPSVTFSTTAGGSGAAATAQIGGQYFSAKISPAGKYYAGGGVTSVEVIDGGEYYRPDAITSVTLDEPGEIFPEGACAFGWKGCQSCPVDVGTYNNTAMVVEFSKWNDLYIIEMLWYVFNANGDTSEPTYIFRATSKASSQTFDSVTFTPESFLNAVQSVGLASGGSSYSSAPSVVFSTEHGTGAEAVASISGSVSSIAVTNGGSGYSQSQPPVVQLSGGGGTSASAVAIVSQSGQVSSVSVTSGGYWYSSPPTVSFAAESGSGAEATAAISGAVVDVTVTKGGLYKYPPDVSFTGGGGSGAAATATLASLPILRSGCYENGTITVSGTDCDTETSQKNCRNFPEQLVANLSGFGPLTVGGFATCPHATFNGSDIFWIGSCVGENADAGTWCPAYAWCGQCNAPVGGFFSQSGGYGTAYAMVAKDATVVLDRNDDIVPGYPVGNAGQNCNVITYTGTYTMPMHYGIKTAPDCQGQTGTVSVSFSASPTGASVLIAPPTSPGGQQAAATIAEISGGGVQSIAVDDGGSGYAREVMVTVAPDAINVGVNTTTGLGATFSVSTTTTGNGPNKRWHVSSVSVTKGGSKYSPGDYLTFSAKGGEMESPPSSYWTVILDRLEPTVTASPSDESAGTGAEFSVSLVQTTDWNTLDVWSVDSVGVVAAGTGYNDGEQIVFSAPGAVVQADAVAQIKVVRYEPSVSAYMDSTLWIGTGASFSVSLSQQDDYWTVSSLSIVSGGSQYTVGAAISFATTGAAVNPAYAVITSVDGNGAITGVSIIDGGNYYATNGDVQEVVVLTPGEYYETTGAIVGVAQDPTNGGSFFKSLATGVVEVDSPEITIAASSGSGATAKANVNASIGSPEFGSITSITVTNPGSGYLSEGQVGWIATLTHDSGPLSVGTFRNYTIPSAGFLEGSKFYDGAPPDSTRMSSCAEDLFDREYPMFLFTGGSFEPPPASSGGRFQYPQQPILSAAMSDPSLSWVEIGPALSRVSFPSVPPTWSLSAIGATLTADGLFDYSPVSIVPWEWAPWTTVLSSAAASVAVTAVVSGITLTAGGSDYTEPPEVKITGGLIAGGVPAQAHAVVAGGVVTEVVVDSCGFGYIAVPTVSIAGGAAAVAVLDGQYVSTKITSAGQYGTKNDGIASGLIVTEFTGPITISLSSA